jgi:hypothetical protein
MPFWTDIAGFCLAALVAILTFLHIWAFCWPHGEISKRLHPSFPDKAKKAFFADQLEALQVLINQGQRPQPDPVVDVELVTTVRRSPRRTQTNASR